MHGCSLQRRTIGSFTAIAAVLVDSELPTNFHTLHRVVSGPINELFLDLLERHERDVFTARLRQSPMLGSAAQIH